MLQVEQEGDQDVPFNLPAPGAPFSALLTSMLPDDLGKIKNISVL